MARSGKTTAEIVRELEAAMHDWADKNVIGAMPPQKPPTREVTLNGREYTMIPEGDVEFPEDGGPVTMTYRLVAKRPMIFNTIRIEDRVEMDPPAGADLTATWTGYAPDGGGPPVTRKVEWKGYDGDD